jgi:hypothetical protein
MAHGLQCHRRISFHRSLTHVVYDVLSCEQGTDTMILAIAKVQSVIGKMVLLILNNINISVQLLMLFYSNSRYLITYQLSYMILYDILS